MGKDNTKKLVGQPIFKQTIEDEYLLTGRICTDFFLHLMS